VEIEDRHRGHGGALDHQDDRPPRMVAVDAFPHEQVNQLASVGERGRGVGDEVIDGQERAAKLGAGIVGPRPVRLQDGKARAAKAQTKRQNHQPKPDSLHRRPSCCAPQWKRLHPSTRRIRLRGLIADEKFAPSG
jgi:hypothetical protein